MSTPTQRPQSPTRSDALARAASEVVGGPAGRRIGGDGPWWSAALPLCLALAAVLVAAGAVAKHHCRTVGWNSPDQFFHLCYSDAPVVYTSSGLARGLGPYAEGVTLSQPPLTAGLAWLVGRFAPHEVTIAAQRAYFDATAVVVVLAGLVVVAAACVAAGRRRSFDVLLVAVCPLLAITGLVSLDLAGVALATAGLACWARRRPVAAGVLLGLAVAARTYPVLLLLALLLLALRAGRVRAFATTALAAAVAWLVVDVPAALTSFDGWSAYLTGIVGQRAGYGSLWLLPQLVEQATQAGTQDGLPAAAVTALTVAAWVVWSLLVTVFVLWAPRRPRLPQVAFLLVAGFCVLGSSFPVQASLWLLPLAALAAPRWRDHVVWWVTEALYFGAVWLFIAGQSTPTRGLPPELYAVFVLLRAAGIAWLVVAVVRDARSPQRDLVRADGDDDPAGGVLDGAPDRLVVRVA